MSILPGFRSTCKTEEHPDRGEPAGDRAGGFFSAGLVLEIGAVFVGRGTDKGRLPLLKKRFDILQIPAIGKLRVIRQPALRGQVQEKRKPGESAARRPALALVGPRPSPCLWFRHGGLGQEPAALLFGDAKRNHSPPLPPVPPPLPPIRRRPPSPSLGQKLGIDRARLIFAEAFLKQQPEPIEAEMGRASVVGAVEKRTVRS